MKTTLYIVIPCYNEEEVLPLTAQRIKEVMTSLSPRISENSRVLFIDDGSKDKTWEIIENLSQENPLFSGVKLSKNMGHQKALLCGYETAKEYCDCAISIDADLQDDLSVIPQFLSKFEEGCQVVYGVRKSRQKDTWFKKTTASCFYSVMSAFGAETIKNHADYRLLGKQALNALASFKEVNLFLRGLVPLVGFKSDVVYYDRGSRAAGVSKYPLGKMLSFAAEGLVSFSIKPIRIILGIGLLVVFLSIIAAIYVLISYFLGDTMAGWASIMISIWFLGGVQLVSIGIIGEFIGRIYREVKARPRYIVEKSVNLDDFTK